MPLYMFTADSRSASRCYGACAAAWPVTKARLTVKAGGAVDPDKLGSIVRRDGTRQVTYAGHPLYYYVDDRPGVALCHDVDEFGGLWLLLKASGRRVA
jgi:predicted lipoprotein with Yx(FWY)xxD motif